VEIDEENDEKEETQVEGELEGCCEDLEKTKI
jgi:hypothetical protein